jgi:hypothetical protein
VIRRPLRFYRWLGRKAALRAANRSDQRMRPVVCVTTNRVMIALTVIASPLKPFQKNA